MGNPAAATEVAVLGSVRARAADGSVIELPSASQRRLLGLLALHSPRTLRAEWLAEQLDVSAGALRTSVSRLRGTIGADALRTSAAGYGLAAEVDVDAARFTRAVADAAIADDRIAGLERALGTWTGPVLDEFSGESWADGEIARLTEIHAGTVDDHAEALLVAGRSAEAVALLEQQTATHPYRDRPRGLLIRALAASGRQSDALRSFQDYRRLLVDELGTEPSPDVVRIERRVATGWNGVESRTTGPLASAPVEVPLPAALRVADGFVGRVPELAALVEDLERVDDGRLHAVALTGESGIGKTTLLGRFAATATADRPVTVLYGRCTDMGVPVEPFGTILRTCVEHAPAELLADHVATCGGELEPICPTLRRRVETAPEPIRSDLATRRFLSFEAAADLLRRVALRRPLVLLLDDLQWADPTALDLLRHLARALADDPVLLVLTFRDVDTAGDELRAALADLERGSVRRVALTGLDDEDLAALAGGALQGDPSEVRRRVTALARETAGNPLYAWQLVTHWNEGGADEVPATLRDLVWQRVHGLGDQAATVLTAACVLGTDVREDVLLDMLDLAEEETVAAIDAATASGLLVEGPPPRRSLHFVHGLVTQALYSDLGGSRCARLHERAARAIEKGADEVTPEVVVQLAHHTRLAGLPSEALRWSTRAGDDALDHLAPAEAAHHYRIALDISAALDHADTERADLLARLGDAEHRAGSPDALDLLGEAAALARSSGADDALIRAVLAADRGFSRLDGSAPDFLDAVEAAVRLVDRADVRAYARLLALLAQSLVFTPQADRRFMLAGEAIELARGSGYADLLPQVTPAALYALWRPATDPVRTQVAAEALAAAEATGDPRLEFSANLSAYNVAVESADPSTAARAMARLRAIARDRAEPRVRWTAELLETFEATMAGRLVDAEALAGAALALGSEIGDPDAFTMFAGQYFVIGTFAGRHADLLPLVEQAMHDNPDVASFELAHAIVCAAVGRDEDARACLDAGVRTGFADLPMDHLWTTAVIGYAVLAIELGAVEAAAELLPVIEPLAGSVAFNGVTSQGPIAAYVGKLASLVDRHEEAEQHLLAALETAEAFGWEYHRATTLLALAQAQHRRDGALDGASRQRLSTAADLCRRGGFASWLPRIEELAG